MAASLDLQCASPDKSVAVVAFLSGTGTPSTYAEAGAARLPV
jgi:hypothetical protein